VEDVADRLLAKLWYEVDQAVARCGPTLYVDTPLGSGSEDRGRHAVTCHVLQIGYFRKSREHRGFIFDAYVDALERREINPVAAEERS
jgi:hypothetical protein